MSQNEVERFLGRIITDAEFRLKASKSLEKACYVNGFSLSTAELLLLRTIDFESVQSIAASIDDSIKRN